jgi:hypothetical protein
MSFWKPSKKAPEPYVFRDDWRVYYVCGNGHFAYVDMLPALCPKCACRHFKTVVARLIKAYPNDKPATGPDAPVCYYEEFQGCKHEPLRESTK